MNEIGASNTENNLIKLISGSIGCDNISCEHCVGYDNCICKQCTPSTFEIICGVLGTCPALKKELINKFLELGGTKGELMEALL